MTTLYLIRHGQSESNLAGIFTGQSDTKLTDLGLRQAEHTAEYLSRFPITKIYSSPLIRARQTAEVFAGRVGLPILESDAFKELNAGLWEGHLYRDLPVLFPETRRLWKERLGLARPDGGESIVELADRVYREIDRILEENRGEHIAIFTHATPVRVMGARWMGIPPSELERVPWNGNASVSIAEYEDDGSFRMIQYSYDKHQGRDATILPNTV